MLDVFLENINVLKVGKGQTRTPSVIFEKRIANIKPCCTVFDLIDLDFRVVPSRMRSSCAFPTHCQDEGGDTEGAGFVGPGERWKVKGSFRLDKQKTAMVKGEETVQVRLTDRGRTGQQGLGKERAGGGGGGRGGIAIERRPS